MKKEDFYFDLPEELIAQKPIEKRDYSKMLVLDRKSGKISDRLFYDVIEFLNPGDTLILNDTKVLPARIYGHRENKEEEIEILLLKEVDRNIWECLVKPGKKMKLNTKVYFKDTNLEGLVIDILEDGSRLIEFQFEGNFIDILNKIGEMPLPPYIHESLKDKNRYQTVFSKELGSAAAPTAGLHFTNELIDTIEKKGVNIGYITLHVGLGTFRPVKAENIEDHKIHSEYIHVDKEVIELIKDTKKQGKKIIAVGTTVVRTLESIDFTKDYDEDIERETNIFIYPGFEFKIVDEIITNFHLPESSLLMLVSAFAGREKILDAYKYAIDKKYRFFSFGDSMFIK